jgi:NADH-quinone oxidoreductase subunit C
MTDSDKRWACCFCAAGPGRAFSLICFALYKMANDPSQKDPNAVPANPAGTPESKPASPPDAPAPASATPPAAAPPKPAAPPKEAPPKPVPLDNELTQRFQKRFGAAIPEAWLDRKQAILIVAREQLLEVSKHCRDEEKFDYLVDLTAVDWPKRERRFDLILNLYSFQKNERLRLKVFVGENEPVASVVAVWPTANWLEREAYDMFGIVFEGHPDLRRILLPEEWQGFPLRKDYDILKQDTAWVKENLGIESGQ